MKAVLIIGCVLGAIIGVFGSLFRIQHWPFALELTIIGGSLFLISFVTLLVKRKKL